MRLTLRQSDAADRGFLVQVYGSTRTEELARTGWDDATCTRFVQQQFDAQAAHYERHFPDAELSIIELEDGRQRVPIGRLWLHRRARALHVLDIAILDAWRCQGWGTQCLQGLMAEADSRRVPLTIKVEVFNPAQELYKRLGFVAGPLHGVHFEMAWHGACISLKETEDEQA